MQPRGIKGQKVKSIPTQCETLQNTEKLSGKKMLTAELERIIINLGFVYLRPFSPYVSIGSYKFSFITAFHYLGYITDIFPCDLQPFKTYYFGGFLVFYFIFCLFYNY